MYTYYVDNGNDIISTHRLKRVAIETARKLSVKNPDKKFYVNKDVKGISGDVWVETLADYVNGQGRSKS